MPPSAFLLKRLAVLMNNAPSQTRAWLPRLGSKVGGRALGTGLQWSGEWWPDEVKELAQKADWSFSVQKKNYCPMAQSIRDTENRRYTRQVNTL